MYTLTWLFTPHSKFCSFLSLLGRSPCCLTNQLVISCVWETGYAASMKTIKQWKQVKSNHNFSFSAVETEATDLVFSAAGSFPALMKPKWSVGLLFSSHHIHPSYFTDIFSSSLKEKDLVALFIPWSGLAWPLNVHKHSIVAGPLISMLTL